MAEEKTFKNLVLVGHCKTSDKKPGVIFLEVVDGVAIESKELVFSAKSFAGLGIGNVYRFEVTGATDALTILPSTKTFVARYTDAEKVVQWRTAVQAQEIRARLEKEEKKAGNMDVFTESLRPIIKAYKQTDYRGRLAIEALVLYILRRMP